MMVGFALESENGLQNAKDKLRRKNFDFIVLNSIRDNGAGFGYDTNKISIVHRDASVKHFELKPKTEVARDIINEIHENLHSK